MFPHTVLLRSIWDIPIGDLQIGGPELIIGLIVIFVGIRLLAALGAVVVRLLIYLVALGILAELFLGASVIPFL